MLSFRSVGHGVGETKEEEVRGRRRRERQQAEREAGGGEGGGEWRRKPEGSYCLLVMIHREMSPGPWTLITVLVRGRTRFRVLEIPVLGFLENPVLGPLKASFKVTLSLVFSPLDLGAPGLGGSSGIRTLVPEVHDGFSRFSGSVAPTRPAGPGAALVGAAPLGTRACCTEQSEDKIK